MTDIKDLQSKADAFNDLVNREIKVWMVRRGEDLLSLAAKLASPRVSSADLYIGQKDHSPFVTSKSSVLHSMLI